MIMKLLKFGAEWCGPCKRFDPVLDKFAEAHPEITIDRIDVDKDWESRKAEIELFKPISVPVSYFITDEGYVVKFVGGAKTLDELEQEYISAKHGLELEEAQAAAKA